MAKVNTTHARYTMSTKYNDVRKEDEVVDAAFVQRFNSEDARDFMIGLGGTEEYERQRGDVHYSKSVSPDGETVRVTVFTPIEEH